MPEFEYQLNLANPDTVAKLDETVSSRWQLLAVDRDHDTKGTDSWLIKDKYLIGDTKSL